jgi:hypothetical protein
VDSPPSFSGEPHRGIDRERFVEMVLLKVGEHVAAKPTPALMESFLKLLEHSGSSRRLDKLERKVAQLTEELDAADRFLKERLGNFAPIG